MLRLLITLALQQDVMKRALTVALVVGVLLNIINQGDKVLEYGIAAISWWKLIFTFCVPFAVSMYTAVSMKLKFKPGDRAPVKLTLSCPVCESSILVQENEVIPGCVSCQKEIIWRWQKK